MELGEAGMDRAGVVCRIGVLGPKVFPAEAIGKGGNRQPGRNDQNGVLGKRRGL